MSFSDTPPGQPLASKRQSPFHQRSLHGLSPLSLLFMSAFFLLFVFPLFPFLILILFSSLSLPLWAPLSFPLVWLWWWTHPFICLCMHWWMLIWGKNTAPVWKIFLCVWCEYECALMFVWHVCRAARGDLLHPDGGRGERDVRCYGIMEDISLISLIIGLSLSHAHTHTS